MNAGGPGLARACLEPRLRILAPGAREGGPQAPRRERGGCRHCRQGPDGRRDRRTSLPATEAVRRLLDLSDRFERADEDLESLIIFAAKDPSSLTDPDLADRALEALETFNERFPSSTAVTRLSAATPAKMITELASRLREGASLRTSTASEVLNGRAPLAAMADADGRSLVKAVACNMTLPMAYGDNGESVADRDGARAAIGMGAVLDAVALTVVAGLQESQRHALLDPLGEATIAAATILIATNAVGLLNDGEEQQSLMLIEGQPVLVAHDPAAIGKERRATLGALAIARDRLGIIADCDAGRPDPYDEHLREHHDRAPALQACIATISAARRSGLPVYSDDRHMRAMVRGEGLLAFPTSALATALADAKIFTAEQAFAIRGALLAEGALGLHPTPTELVEAATGADWNPAAPWSQLLHDRVAWRSETGRQFGLLDAMLRAADEHRPNEMGLWAARALNAFRRGLPEGRLPRAAAALVALSWTISPTTDPTDHGRCIRLYRAISDAPRLILCARFDNLLPDCLDYIFAYARGNPAPNDHAIIRYALARLPYYEIANVLIAMAQASAPPTPRSVGKTTRPRAARQSR